MEQDYNLKKWSKGCPNTGVNCRRSSCGIEYVFIPAALGDDQEGSPVAPKNGSYNNAIVYYEATGNVYLYSSDGVPTRVEKNLDSIIAELQRELDNVEEALSEETSAREAADAAIEQEIEDLRNEPDVVDIVGTYADLLAYDTSNLGDKDVIRVLVDETHDDESTYYRWNKTPQTWTYIGAIDGYYTKDQTDTLLEGKQDVLTAGTNVQISSQNVISATDTTYSDFTGTDGTAAGTSGLVPAPATTDAGKFLKADGTWETVQAGGGATIFYINNGLIGWGEDEEGPLFYKDSSYQTPATASEMYAACMTGSVYICSNQSDDLCYTEIVAMSNYDTNYTFSLTDIEHGLGFDCTINSYISSGTEYYNFYYNEPSTIDVVQTTGSSTTNVMSQNAVTTGLAGKQDTLTAGTNITIDANNVISAAGGGSGPTVVQATGTSTTDVMSQNAATNMVFPNNDTQRVQIGAGASTVAYTQGVAIGRNAHARSTTTVAIGSGATAEDVSGVAIGNLSDAAEPNSVALGGSAVTSRRGEVNVGTGRYNYGYNSTPYRVIGGVHDGQTAHDVATVGQLNGRVLTSAGAPTTSTVGTVGQLYEDTTNGKLYICTDATNPYVWEEVGSGGGGGATIFYKDSGLVGWGEDIEGPLFYKDSSYQTPATSSDIYAACMAGTTYICSNQSDDLFYTEIVAASNYSTNYNFSLTNIEHGLGYDCTINSYISSGTEYYNFYYNEPSTIDVVQTTGSSTTNVMSQNAVTTGLAGKQDTLTAGTGISINNNVISASGGETMLVTLTKTTIGQYSNVWVWSSDYTFAQLTANPDAIRVFVNDWCYASEGNIKPTYTKVETFEQSTKISLVRDLAGVEMSFILNQPREIEGQTVNPAIFDVTNFVDENKTLLTILPTLTLADNATYIPDGTTITLQAPSSDKEMYGEIGSSDCYPHRDIITGNFMILPVRRKVGSGESYWVEEECLIMSVTRRGEPSVADSYIYKTFMFNGEYYKMTLTNSSYPNEVYTITKIPGGH